VFSSIWGVAEATALLIHAWSSVYQLFDEIADSLPSPKRENQVGLYHESEGAKGLVHLSQTICLEKFYSKTLSL
jgi:hypothetical protein